MSIEEALLKLVEYQVKDVTTKQTVIDFLTKEIEELKSEIYSIKVRNATDDDGLNF